MQFGVSSSTGARPATLTLSHLPWAARAPFVLEAHWPKFLAAANGDVGARAYLARQVPVWPSARTSHRAGTSTGRRRRSRSECGVREVMPELTRWWEAGATVGMGTVVAIRGSSPREPGPR